MRWGIVPALVAGWLAAAPEVARAACDDPFADPDQVISLHLRMTRADWSSIVFDDLVGSGCDAQYPYHEVEFRCGDDQPWIAIGARKKRGDQRGMDTDQKPPIKLDFNRFVSGQRWPAARGSLGFRKLTLNNGQADNPGGVLSALLTEHLAWRLMRREVAAASGVAYARLFVHFVDDDEVEYHGLYILIEDIDRTAIRARYGADRGVLLKTTTGSCRDKVVFADDGDNQARDGFEDWFALDPDDFSGGWRARTEQAIDLDDLLRDEALRDVLAIGRDTLLGRNFSNYFSFDPVAGKRHYLPWDLDDAFRVYPQTVPFDEPLEPSCSPIGDRTRCAPEIRDRYYEIACQLATGTLAEERLLGEYHALDALVRPIVAEEVEPVWAGFGDPLDPSTAGTYAAEVERLDVWIAERIPEVRRQLEALGTSCPDLCVATEPEPCSRLGRPGERRCEEGRWTPCVVDEPEPEPEPCPDPDACDGPGDMVSGGCSCRTGGAGGRLTWALLFLLVTRRRRGHRAEDRGTRSPAKTMALPSGGTASSRR